MNIGPRRISEHNTLRSAYHSFRLSILKLVETLRIDSRDAGMGLSVAFAVISRTENLIQGVRLCADVQKVCQVP